MKLIERLNAVRLPRRAAGRAAAIGWPLALFSAGAVLGVLAKWLDALAFDGAVWWHRALETLDLGNFLSDMAFWLAAGLVIAAFSRSPWRAALHVFLFFAAMCGAYHAYSVLVCGFDPRGYMLIWYGLTLASPVPAAVCWYAKGNGPAAVVLAAGVMTVMTLACFAVGRFYVDLRGVLYLLAYAGAAAALYRRPWQTAVSLPVGFALAFVFCPLWPFA